MNRIRFLTVFASGCLAAAIACRSDSSANLQTLRDSAEAHARDRALGWVAGCLGRHGSPRSADVLAECEGAGRDSTVRVHIVWATAGGWGVRASKAGVAGDCVYIAGLASESQYLFTSGEHRGAVLGGATCDGGTTTVPRSWPEFVQASFALALRRELRARHKYQASHAGAFPPADSMPLHSDSVGQYRYLWARPDGIAIEASAAALPGVTCVIWDGAAIGHAAPTTAGHRVVPAGVATCDDFRSARRIKS